MRREIRRRLRPGAAARSTRALALFALAIAAAALAARPARLRTENTRTPTTPLPGAAPLPRTVNERLLAAAARNAATASPTRHRRDDGTPRYLNRLILEDSPYLLEHAHDPIDWLPWGPEAFARARREGKPVFLSIGYASCHWCHVMQRESFDDLAVATRLNRDYVSIKVDRERRPEVDEVYMTALQLARGGGGWPIAALLTGDGKPFFVASYMPSDRLLELLERAAAAWRERRPEIDSDADRLAAAVARVVTTADASARFSDDLFARASADILARFDARSGGFSRAPKFPHAPELLFLLERRLRTGETSAGVALAMTLDRMARGGIFDQLGGGFHRYATDENWLVPHFEKTLPDQALLARAYLAAWRLDGDPLAARVTRQTLDFVLRELASSEGALHAALDADSEGEEGRFYLWTPAEIDAALAPSEARFARRLFGVSAAGNFAGRNVLSLPSPWPESAREHGVAPQTFFTRVDRVRDDLAAARAARVAPRRDENVVTEWNAMSVTALAEAGQALDEPRYLAAARRTAKFLWLAHRRSDGTFWRSSFAGRATVAATQADYAALAEALATLYDATGERIWLTRARAVATTLLERFWDAERGGFYMSGEVAGDPLPTRPRSLLDGAAPAGASLAVRALAMLSARSGDDALRRRAQAALASVAGAVSMQPSAFPYLLLAADELRHGAAGDLEYGAAGALRARADVVERSPHGAAVAVHLTLAPGWHINAAEGVGDDLVPTRLALAPGSSGARLGAVAYPEPERLRLAFRNGPLAVYRGAVSLRGTVTLASFTPYAAVHLELHVQACDDHACLRPETLTLELPAIALAARESAPVD